MFKNSQSFLVAESTVVSSESFDRAEWVGFPQDFAYYTISLEAQGELFFGEVLELFCKVFGI